MLPKMIQLFQVFVFIVLIVSITVILNTGQLRSFNSLKQREQSNNQPKNKQPHLVLIVADDLGFNDVGYHGSNITTPILDKLAISGVRLENYYTQAVCTPTRAALLTGRYPIHTGIQRAFLPGQALGMPLDEPTLADKLREAGYATHIIGKWHLGFHKRSYLPTNRGFDSFFGFYCGYSDYFTHISKHYNGVKGYDLFENEDPVNWTTYNGYYSTDLFADKTIDIIRNHNAEKPLFAYLAFQAVHSPVQAPKKYVKQSQNSRNNLRDIYEGMVRCMDNAVGRVVEALKRRGFWENTILVFTSDNGGPPNTGASNWPLKGHKASGWEGGVRGVGFVHSTLLSSKASGSVSKELMHVTDWFPTFVNLAGGNLNGTKPLDGFDQWKSIMYDSPSMRKEILHDILPSDRIGDPLPHPNMSLTSLRRASLRIGEWKMLKEFSAKRSAHDQLKEVTRAHLFNIVHDPAEERDISKEFPDLVQNMLKRIESYHKGTVPSPNPKEDLLADPRYRKGYWDQWND